MSIYILSYFVDTKLQWESFGCFRETEVPEVKNNNIITVIIYMLKTLPSYNFFLSNGWIIYSFGWAGNQLPSLWDQMWSLVSYTRLYVSFFMDLFYFMLLNSLAWNQCIDWMHRYNLNSTTAAHKIYLRRWLVLRIYTAYWSFWHTFYNCFQYF